MKISVVLPCRNEEGSIAICIEKIKKAFESIKEKDYEIIVSDSSKDKSTEIAKNFSKVKIVKHSLDGYGNVIIQGIKHAKGDYIIIGDADNTYDFLEIPKFIEQLDKGYDFVLGSRFKGKIEKGAMPLSHRYICTPILNFLLSLFFKKKISDCNSGFRAIKREAFNKLSLKTTGIEFASEMLINAVKNNLKIKEVSVRYQNTKSIKFNTLRGHTFINSFDNNSVLVDLGANIGEFSRLLSKKYSFSKIILIEANPKLIKKLKNNFKGKKNVHIVNAVAIGGKAKKIKFYLSKNTESSSIYKRFRDKFGEDGNQMQVIIDTISLRQIFEKFNLKKINLLKIDIEGAEWNFLKEFSKQDYQKIDQISIEFHDFIDSSLKHKSDKIINKLKDVGYSFISIGSDFLEGTPYKNCLFYKSALLKIKR